MMVWVNVTDDQGVVLDRFKVEKAEWADGGVSTPASLAQDVRTAVENQDTLEVED